MLLHYFDAHRDGFTVDDAGERHQSSSDESDAVFFEGRDGAAVVEDPVLPRSLLVLRLLLLLLVLLLGGGGRLPREGERQKIRLMSCLIVDFARYFTAYSSTLVVKTDTASDRERSPWISTPCE